jgi:glycosyltransferase involved in cell wall biosynthesis
LPKFSIIIPTYNRASKLEVALNSLKEQTYRDFDVYVCDDGSTDETKRVVESFSQSLDLFYLWEKNWGGPARPRNRGLEAAKGEWICFLDSDDWWSPNRLLTMLSKAESSDIMYHALKRVDDGGRVLGTLKTKALRLPIFENLMIYGNCIPLSSLCVRKTILNKVGHFSEEKNLIGVEDFELLLRISKITNNFYYFPQPLGSYRLSSDNISRPSCRFLNSTQFLSGSYSIYLHGPELKLHQGRVNYEVAAIMRKVSNYRGALPLFLDALTKGTIEVRFRSLISIALVILKMAINCVQNFIK